MPDNKQPIEYYVAEAKRLGLTEEQQSVIGHQTDGDAFREHIANAHDMTDAELREILAQEWDNYSADNSGEDEDASFDREAEAADEANGRHADSEPEGDDEDEGWEDEDELDDEDDDFGSDVGEDDEDFDSSSDADDLESGDEPEEDSESSDELNEDSLDHLEIDEDAIDQKRSGGGEALDDGEADCEGCKI